MKLAFILSALTLTVFAFDRDATSSKSSPTISFSDLMVAVVAVESGGREKIVGDDGKSLGLGQVQYHLHAKKCGLKNRSELFDAKINLRCSALVMQNCAKRFKTIGGMLNCYNGDCPKNNCGNGQYAHKVLSKL